MRCVFAPSHQIIHSQETRAESQSCPAEALVLSEVKNLQAELQNTLRALQQQQQDPANLLDDDKVHKTTFQCHPFVEFSLSFKTFK